MDIFTVAFFGHRYVDNIFKIEDTLYQYIKNLVKKKEYVEFLVGRNGDFDISVSSVINRVKNDFLDENCSHILVLPYMTSEYVKNKDSFEDYYDEIEVYDFASRIHPKAVIGLRNNKMVDSADLIICYVKEKHGGAYKAMKYAESQGKEVINIAMQI